MLRTTSPLHLLTILPFLVVNGHRDCIRLVQWLTSDVLFLHSNYTHLYLKCASRASTLYSNMKLSTIAVLIYVARVCKAQFIVANSENLFGEYLLNAAADARACPKKSVIKDFETVCEHTEFVFIAGESFGNRRHSMHDGESTTGARFRRRQRRQR